MVAIDPIAATPVGFTNLVLGVPTYDWQAAVLSDLETHGQVALRCPNEAGKTAHIAVGAILWHMMVFPGSVTVVTSGTYRQVKEQLMPGLQRQSAKPCFKGWDFGTDSIKAPSGARLVAFSTDDPGKFEGFHKLPAIKVGEDENGEPIMEVPPLFIVVDEAKSVQQGIFTAIDRCRPDRLLIMSSPGGSTGDFYWAFGKNRHLYKTHAVGLKDCPHLDKDVIAKIVAKYGEDHPFVQSSVHGKFADNPDDGNVIAAAVLGKNRLRKIQWVRGEKHAFCDFAAGGDENVFALRDGNRVGVKRAWRELNTMAACGEFIQLFIEYGLKPEEISGDNSGLGRPMIDRLHEMGWPINRVDNGSRAHNPQAYKDRGSEIWGEGAKMIADCKMIVDEDEELDAQLTTRPWEDRTSDGALKLMSKKVMKKLGMTSPDRADSVLGAMQPTSGARVNFAESNDALQPVTEWQQEQELEEVCHGFDAGY